MRPIGILGGTFDPIHLGHIKLALEALHQLGLVQVRFIPVHIPPHRAQPVASTSDRKAMLELALDEQPELVIDCRELHRAETSYTINTLKSLRDELPDTPLCLIMGHDAFARIDSWHQWQALLNYAHIIVASRPGPATDLPVTVNEWTEARKTDQVLQLQQQLAGHIYFMEIPLLDISSTSIRSALAREQDAGQWLHCSTYNYIKQHQLYQDAA